MTSIWMQISFVFFLAILASIVSRQFRISTALSEILIGMLARLMLTYTLGAEFLSVQEPWIRTFAGIGAIFLTFLAGAELDPDVFKLKWKESLAIGVSSFLLPSIGCWGAAHFLLGWDYNSSLLAGIALAATSVAVVYTVMMEYGFNKGNFGKTILAACFITDLGTVITLGLVFAPFTWKTLLFVSSLVITFLLLPKMTRHAFHIFGGLPSEFETRYLLFFLLALGALATWADSEAVLPAYLIGMALAGTVGRDHALIKRLRTITIGLLTPFYFIRAGYFISIPAVLVAPISLVILLFTEMSTKIISVYPVARHFGSPHKDAMYTTLLMASGLTFGTICALFGLSHKIINEQQYSTLVACIIATAIIPTLIANTYYLPEHHLPKDNAQELSEEPGITKINKNSHR